MAKDADAYRTISEVADALDIPAHVLRFWETKFPQVKPLKRGGGRRYYRRADTDLLRSIRRLLYDEGYTIRGVQRLLKVQGSVRIAALADSPGPIAVDEAQGEPENPQDVALSDKSENAMSPIDQRALMEAVDMIRSEIEICRSILEKASRPA